MAYVQHREYNETVDQFVRQNANTYLLDMRKIVRSRSQLTNNIRHYTRDVYYQMAAELTGLINVVKEINLSAQQTEVPFWRVKRYCDRFWQKHFLR